MVKTYKNVFTLNFEYRPKIDIFAKIYDYEKIIFKFSNTLLRPDNLGAGDDSCRFCGREWQGFSLSAAE